MLKNKAFVFRIFPNEQQKEFFEQTFGNIRYLYNKFIYDNYDVLLNRDIKSGEQPSKFKKAKETSFLKLGDSLALANNYLNLKKALSRANSSETLNAKRNKIRKITKNDKNLPASIVEKRLAKAERFGLPRFKQKSGKQSYTTNNQLPSTTLKLRKPTIRLENDLLYLPKIKSGIKIHRHRSISKNMLIKSVTVKKHFKDFYEVSILVEYQSNVKLLPIKDITLNKVEGLDFSIPEKFVNSLGEKANSQDYYRINEEKISLLNRKIMRNKEISKVVNCNSQGKNIEKLQLKLNKLHYKIKMNRKQENHILANKMLNEYDLIVLEDIDLRAMSQCLNFGKSIYDKGFGEFRTILLYKAMNLGKYVLKVDKFFPSSKKCSNCGYKHSELKLKDRTYECPQCYHLLDRDQNSGINLKNEGYRILQEFLNKEFALPKKDPNKILYNYIMESNTPEEPANSFELGCSDYRTLHGNNKPTLQANG